MNRRDPRIRRTLDDLSTTFENISTQTQTAAFSFTQTYLNPCFASLSECLDALCAPCIAYRRDRVRARRQRHFSRVSSRPELVFDFYNDAWEDGDDDVNERTGLLGGWGGEDLDRLIGGSGTTEQPRGHRRTMNYGSRGGTGGGPNRSRGATISKGEGKDPTIIPGSSMFGFLERLPWRIGGRGVRYRPSAADLQEGLGRKDRIEGRTEGEALLDDSEDNEWGEGGAYGRRAQHKRQRSNTMSSKDTENSLSSRGDLFPSDEEDDALLLDDSFAMALERRSTGEEGPSSGARSTKSKLSRTMSGFTTASKSTKSSKKKRKSKSNDAEPEPPTPTSDLVTPSSEVKMSLDEGEEEGTEAEAEDSLLAADQLRQEEDTQVRNEEDAGDSAAADTPKEQDP